MFESISRRQSILLSSLITSFEIKYIISNEEDYSDHDQNIYNVQIRFSVCDSRLFELIKSYHFMICFVVAISNLKELLYHQNIKLRL